MGDVCCHVVCVEIYKAMLSIVERISFLCVKHISFLQYLQIAIISVVRRKVVRECLYNLSIAGG